MARRGNPNMRPGAPSVNPSGGKKKRAERRDGWSNEASGHGTSRDRRTLTRYGVDIVTDLEAMQLWRSEWLAAKIIEERAREIFRRGYEIKSEGADAKKLAAVLTRAQELELDKRFVLAEQYRDAYGGAAIFGAMDGALDALDTPLDETSITSVKAFHVLEPRELWPLTYYTDLLSPKFGLPETYQLMPLTTGRGQSSLKQSVIHESRLLIFVGPRVSRMTQPGQRESWGDSKLSRTKSTLADYGLSWGSAATVLAEFGEGVLELDGLDEILKEDGGQTLLQRRIDAMALGRSALGVTVVGGGDKYTRTNTTLGGMSDVLAQQAYVVAAAAGYPISVLLGMVHGGLSTGDNDVRTWYAKLDAERNAETKPLLEQALRWIMKSTDGPFDGQEPEVWSAAFRPLWEPTEKEQAETAEHYATTDEKNINNRIYTASEARSRYKGDGTASRVTLDPSVKVHVLDPVKASQAIAAIELAGLPPNHPAKKVLYEAAGLPWQKEDETPLMLPRVSPFGAPPVEAEEPTKGPEPVAEKTPTDDDEA